MKTCDKIINFFNSLEPATLPQNIEILDPYHSKEVNSILFSFYNKYFNDSKRRILIFGIKPNLILDYTSSSLERIIKLYPISIF